MKYVLAATIAGVVTFHFGSVNGQVTQCSVTAQECLEGGAIDPDSHPGHLNHTPFESDVCYSATLLTNSGDLECLFSDYVTEKCDGEKRTLEEKAIQLISTGLATFQDECVDDCNDLCAAQSALWTKAINIGACSKAFGTCFKESFTLHAGTQHHINPCHPNHTGLYKCVFGSEVFGVCKDSPNYMDYVQVTQEQLKDKSYCLSQFNEPEETCCINLDNIIAQEINNRLESITDSSSTTRPINSGSSTTQPTNTGSAATTYVSTSVIVVAVLVATISWD